MVGQARPRQATSPGQNLLEPWADQIYQWITNDRLQMTRIREFAVGAGLCGVVPVAAAFSSSTATGGGAARPQCEWRTRPPGEVVEADFGRLGMITDPATGQRKAIWPMQHQKLPDVIAGLEAAWAFFGGMPKYLVIDNFPAAVVGTDPLNPILTRGFLEYAQHRDMELPVRIGVTGGSGSENLGPP